MERRSEIFDVYTNLRKASCVIITLGFIESWFDNQTQLFLNRMPPASFKTTDPKRFSFKVLDVFDSYLLLEKAMSALQDYGINVILTVSPVPLHVTFTGSDCITANQYSKSVLRVCAEQLCKRFSNVDYFPSYEIVRSGGLNSYINDHIHVKQEVVNKITNLMIKKYVKSDDIDVESDDIDVESDDIRADRFREKAIIYINQNNFEKALENLKSAYAIRPHGPYIRLQLINVLIQLKRFDEVNLHLDFLKNPPEYVETHPLLKDLLNDLRLKMKEPKPLT